MGIWCFPNNNFIILLIHLLGTLCWLADVEAPLLLLHLLNVCKYFIKIRYFRIPKKNILIDLAQRGNRSSEGPEVDQQHQGDGQEEPDELGQLIYERKHFLYFPRKKEKKEYLLRNY